MRPPILLVATIITCLFRVDAVLAQPTPRPSAVLHQFNGDKGDIEITAGSDPARPVVDADKGRLLFQGDVLTCKKPGASFILLNGILDTVEVTQCSQGYVIAAPTGTYVPVIERYGRTAGRSRGSMLGVLLWPVTGIRTMPSTASHLQWRKQSAGAATATATLKEAGSGRLLWTRSRIDPTLGALHDPGLESALRAQVDAGKTDPVLDLRISDALRASATITLLDRAAEQTLQQQLASAAALGDAARHLVRADAFLEGHLPREALDEYVAMLEQLPESTLLLTKASALAVEISDPRAADLVKRARAAGGS
jgi:hypothetical protein